MGGNVLGMTPKKNIRIDFAEITSVEITCKCGAAIALPVLMENGEVYVPLPMCNCGFCQKPLWSAQNDLKRLAVAKFIESVGQWKKREQLPAESRPNFSLSITVPSS